MGFAKAFTKLAHGLRPPSFLVETLRMMCALWHIPAMLGIDPADHIKGRWNQRRTRLKFDYRSLWGEQGANRDAQGYWAMSTGVAARDLFEIPSKKRSMYRKRFDLLDEMRCDIAAILRPQRLEGGRRSLGAPWGLVA